MAIEMEEDYLGRGGRGDRRFLRYNVTGTDDDGAVVDYVVSNAPTVHDGMSAREISSISQVADMRWIVTVSYGALDPSTIRTPEPDTASYTFAYYAEPETFYFSVDRQKTVPDDFDLGVNGLIGVAYTRDEGGSYEGIDVPNGPVTDVITYEFPRAKIYSPYRKIVMELMGGVNDDVWLDGEAGTRRFVSCTSSITSSGGQTIEFGFAYRPTRKDVKRGDLELGDIEGWDFDWAATWTRAGIFNIPQGDPVQVHT
ncbi:unnamed protein product, partial [marine sediment metagenome]